MSQIEMNLTKEPIHSAASGQTEKPAAGKFCKYGPSIFVTLAAFAYAIAAAWRTDQPGLYYDECLFINAALGAPDNDTFVWHRIFGVPVMCMSYVGALKSLLFAPIFYFFGVTVETIRLPALAISSGTLLITYFVARRFLPAWIAGLFTLLLGTDPSFVLQTRVDWGPIALQSFLKMSAVYCLIRCLQDNSWRYFSMTLVLLTLGVYDKLNFVWVVVALVPATLVYWRALWKVVKTHPKQIAVSSAIFVSVMSFFYFQLVRPLLCANHPIDPIGRFQFACKLYRTTFSGDKFYCWIFQKHLPHEAIWAVLWAPFAFLVSLFASLNLRLQSRVDEDKTRLMQAIVFIAILTGMLLLQLIVTESAVGPHHMMILWPFPHMLILLSAYLVVKMLPQTLRRAATLVACLGFVLWCGTNVLATIDFYCACSKYEMQKHFSRLIVDLTRYLQARSNEVDHIAFVDWGYGTQVSALSDRATRKKCEDVWIFFNPYHYPVRNATRQELDDLTEPFFSGKCLAVQRAPGKETFPRTRIEFSEFLKRTRRSAKLVKTFREGKKPLYEVYEISHITSAGSH